MTNVKKIKQDNISNKIQWIELGRCLAIITVILCHMVEIVYSTNLSNSHYLNMDFMSKQDIFSKTFAHFAFTMGRLGVPIFLMITGYLLFDRKYDKAGCKRFYLKNFLKLFLCAEIWIILYNIFIALSRKTDFSMTSIIKQMTFTSWVKLDHWWFMNMIVITYLLIPVVANLIQRAPKKLMKFLFIAYCIYTGLYKIIDDILVAFGHKDLPDSISLGYTYGIFVIYLVMGYLIKKGVFKKLSTKLLLTISLITFTIVVIFQILAYSVGEGFNVWYDCPVLWVSTVAMFEMTSRIKNIKFYNIVKQIAYYSFAIYLVHIIIRELMFDFIIKFTTHLPLVVIISTFINFAITYLCVYIIGKIPKVGKFILYLK